MRPPRNVSRSWRLVLFVVASLTAFDADAAPITTMRVGAGTLTASLDLWREDETKGFIVEFVESFSLGTDFTVAVPQAVLDANVSWQPNIPPLFSGFPAGWAGLHLVISAPKVLAAPTVEALSDACGPEPGYLDGVMVMARRGTCTFATKSANIQAANGAAAIIVNNIPGTDAIGMSLGTFLPDIPVIGLSYSRGEQLVAVLTDPTYHYYPLFDLDIRWDPDPVVDPPVPEPGALGLLALGLAAGVGRWRRKMRSR